MFIEVPNIEKIKNKELFDMIKNEIKSKEVFYYKINNNIIFGFNDKTTSNLLLRKLVKRLFENGEKNFIVISLNQEDLKYKKIDVFVSMNKKIITNSYRMELGSFLSIINNNKPTDNEPYNIFYIMNQGIEEIIDNITEITEINKEIFTPVQIDFNKEDEKEIVKELTLDDIVKNITTKFNKINVKRKDKVIEQYKVNKKNVLLISIVIFLFVNGILIYSYYLNYQDNLVQEQLFKEEQDRIAFIAQKKIDNEKRIELENQRIELEKKLEQEKIFKEKFIIVLKKNMEIYEFLSLTKKLQIDYVQIKNNFMELLLKNKDNLNLFEFKDMSIMDDFIILSNVDFNKTLEKMKKNGIITDNNLDFYKSIVIPELDEKITKINKFNGSLEKNNDNNIFSFRNNIYLKDVDFVFKNNRHELNIYLQNQINDTVKLFVSEDDDIIKKLEDEKKKEKELQDKRANLKKVNIN